MAARRVLAAPSRAEICCEIYTLVLLQLHVRDARRFDIRASDEIAHTRNETIRKRIYAPRRYAA